MAIDRMKPVRMNQVTNVDIVDGELVIKRLDKSIVRLSSSSGSGQDPTELVTFEPSDEVTDGSSWYGTGAVAKHVFDWTPTIKSSLRLNSPIPISGITNGVEVQLFESGDPTGPSYVGVNDAYSDAYNSNSPPFPDDSYFTPFMGAFNIGTFGDPDLGVDIGITYQVWIASYDLDIGAVIDIGAIKVSLASRGELSIGGGPLTFSDVYGDLRYYFGPNAFANVDIQGYDTIATANTAHAEGRGTSASGGSAHAEGYRTSTSGFAGHSEGYQTIASGAYTHAEGQSTTASGNGAHTEGEQTLASGEASHAEGAWTEATGAYSHAEGWNTDAIGIYSHAEGKDSGASEQMAHAEGYNTSASAAYSHAEGNSTHASGQSGHAEGVETLASGQGCHAEGFESHATNIYDHAEGNGTVASGGYSHAEGSGGLAAGQGSHKEGTDTQAMNDSCHSEGLGTLAEGAYSHAEGWGSQSRWVAGHASAAGHFEGPGDAQYERIVCKAEGPGTLLPTPNIPDGMFATFTAEVVSQGVDDDNIYAQMWTVVGAVRGDVSIGPQLVGIPTVTPIGDYNSPGYILTIGVDSVGVTFTITDPAPHGYQRGVATVHYTIVMRPT